ncbi:MAG: hypothetical protein ABIO70_23500 [Pseudomonadota bacterium]
MDQDTTHRHARCAAYLTRIAAAEGWQTLTSGDITALATLALSWGQVEEGGGARDPDEKKARVAFLLGAPLLVEGAPAPPRELRYRAIRAHLVRLAEADGWCKLGPSALDEIVSLVLRDADQHHFGVLPTLRAVLAADRNLGTLYYWHIEPSPSTLGRGVVSLERFCRWITARQLKEGSGELSRLGGQVHDVADRVFDLAYDHVMRNIRRVAIKLDHCRDAMRTLEAGGEVDWARLEVPWELDGGLDRRTGEVLHPADHLTRHHLHYRVRKRWLPQAIHEALRNLPLDPIDRPAQEQQVQERTTGAGPAADVGADRRDQERAEVAGRLWFLMDWGERTARPAEGVTWRQLAFEHWGQPLPPGTPPAGPRQNEPRHIVCDAGARFRYCRGLGRALWRAEREGLSLPGRLDFERDPRPETVLGLTGLTEDLTVGVSQVEAPGKERYALRRVLQHQPEVDRPAMHLVSIANATCETTDPATGHALVIQQVDGASGADRQRRLLDLALEAGLNAGALRRSGRDERPVACAPEASRGAGPSPAGPEAGAPTHGGPGGGEIPCGHHHERALWSAASRGAVPSHAQLDEMLATLQTCGDCRGWWREQTSTMVATAELEAAMLTTFEQDMALEEALDEEADGRREAVRWLELEEEG